MSLDLYSKKYGKSQKSRIETIDEWYPNYITRTKSLEFHRNLSNHLIHPTNVQRNEIPFDEYATIWNRKWSSDSCGNTVWEIGATLNPGQKLRINFPPPGEWFISRLHSVLQKISPRNCSRKFKPSKSPRLSRADHE